MTSIQDSGCERRYKKISGSGCSNASFIIECAKSCTLPKNNMNVIYADFAKKILQETCNLKEKAIVFDNNGKILVEKDGTRNAVIFEDSESAKMADAKLIHNHPSGFSFSEQDVKMALHNGLKEIAICAGRHTLYKLIINDNKDIKKIMLQYEQSKKEVQSTLLALYKDRKITKKEIECDLQHYVMSVFSNKTKEVRYEKTKY